MSHSRKGHWKWHHLIDCKRVPIGSLYVTLALYVYIIYEIKRDIDVKSRFSYSHLHSTPSLGVIRRIIAITYVVEKLECWGYEKVKKFENMYVYSFQYSARVMDGWTDKNCTATKTALCIASGGKN